MLKSIIIGDPQGKAYDFVKNVYNWLEKKDGNFELCEIKRKEDGKDFADGEPYVHIPSNIRERKCYFIHDSTKEPCRWLTELALINDTLKRSSPFLFTDVLPYMKFSRQERKSNPREPVSAKALADIIMATGGKKLRGILTVDLHSPVIGSFYDIPCDNLYSFPSAATYFKDNYADFLKNVVIVSPDRGGLERAGAFAKRINITDLGFINKTRPEKGKAEVLHVVGDVKGKNILIIDDMIDSGGTIIKGAEALKKAGAEQIFVYAAHAVFSNNAKEKLKECNNVSKVIISDIIPQIGEKIETISLAPLVAEAIYKIDRGESVSSLFD